MNKKQSSLITTLYYRLYVTYFEANQDVLKLTNRNAFYRLSIYDGENQIAEMAEGINPVILADKIFLNRAVLNFNNTTSKTLLKVKLRSHFGTRDNTLGEADLDLQRINDNYFQFTQRFNSLQTITFTGQGGELKLIFNIFVEKNKVDLDLYIKKFKENEREVMKAKRYATSRKKIEAEQKVADIQNMQIPQQNKLQNNEYVPKRALEQREVRERSRSKSNKKKKLVEVVTSNNMNYLQINSAARFKQKKLEKSESNSKKLLSQIQEKQFQAYSSKMQSFQNSKILPYDAGSTSIISDGSQQSEMINNNLTQSYSQRAVARFKQKTYRCLNVIVAIVVLTLLYFLLSPRAKIQKKGRNKSRIKISDIAQEIIDI